MAEVSDVARRILDLKGPITSMKLEKLVFYSQAYSLSIYGRPLFEDRIEAWVNGPVVPDLYRMHRGMFMVRPTAIPSNESLTQSDGEVISWVVSKLGDFSGEELRELTHSEKPWRDARKGLRPSDRGSQEITQQSIESYYGTRPISNPLFA